MRYRYVLLYNFISAEIVAGRGSNKHARPIRDSAAHLLLSVVGVQRICN
jgi:hypothetical protein